MNIQWQVSTINRHVRFHHQARLPVGGACDTLGSAPEEAVVHDEKIHPGLGGLSDNRLGGIHRCANTREAT